MTRISASIQPHEFCDKHISGEIYEITRVPTAIKSGRAKIANIPDTFRLGTGHVRFFYNKIAYLHRRYIALIHEAQKRGFKHVIDPSIFENIPPELYNDWSPSIHDRKEIIPRLNLRLSKMKNLKYYSKSVQVEDMLIDVNSLISIQV